MDADTSLDADLVDEAGRDAEEAYFDGEDVEAEVQMHEEGGHAVCTDTGVQDY